MKPSLDQAYFRVRRARQHINALRRFERIIAIGQDDIIKEADAEPIEELPGGRRRYHSPKFTVPEPPPSDMRWVIRFGEAIYNLRTALDYLMYSLAYLDSEKPQNGTQFPICNSPRDFDNKVDISKRHCIAKGIDPTHIAAIKDLQPFRRRDFMDGCGSRVSLVSPTPTNTET